MEQLLGVGATIGDSSGGGDRIVEHRPDVYLARGRVDQPPLRKVVHVLQQRVLDRLDRRIQVRVRRLDLRVARRRAIAVAPVAAMGGTGWVEDLVHDETLLDRRGEATPAS